MLVRIPKPWERIAARETPEEHYANRRRFLKLGAAAASTILLRPLALAAEKTPPAPAGPPISPSPRNSRYTLDRPVTPERFPARHNVFDEFSLERDQVWKLAESLRTRPWTIHIGGLVESPINIDAEELIRKMELEERLYRFRCVETWAMAVPWTGFPFRKFIEFCRPMSRATYVRMVSFTDTSAPGWYAGRRVFPYYEGLSLAEANNELTLLATGIYGHPLPNQHGAPLRLIVPWKYGLKGIKSIVAFQFTKERPGTFWNELSPDHYSFESNVNPLEPGQESEEMIDTGEKRKTLPFNGYGEYVSALYS
jgi:methionine sulfoxide reductase catalytic subunit